MKSYTRADLPAIRVVYFDRLENESQLAYSSYEKKVESIIQIKTQLGNAFLVAEKGPEYSLLSEVNQKELLNAKYTIRSDSNRMAYRVKHSIDLSHSYSIISSGTLPGTVQLTPSGELIILMRDAQTTGGYPRVLQLTEEAICNLSQLLPNEIFSFKLKN